MLGLPNCKNLVYTFSKCELLNFFYVQGSTDKWKKVILVETGTGVR